MAAPTEPPSLEAPWPAQAGELTDDDIASLPKTEPPSAESRDAGEEDPEPDTLPPLGEPEWLGELPEDPEADALDPIRLAALQVRGVDPSLLDEPIVDDFDDAEHVGDAVEEVTEDVDLVDAVPVDDVTEDEDDEPPHSVRPLATPPPPPPPRRPH